MCGIAGAIDMTGNRLLPFETLQAMADAIFHRGPDEDGFFQHEGVNLANRRLSIVGLADGRQPIGNEDGSIQVVFNGELFDYPEVKAQLETKGHVFRTHCDTELFPHLWEEYGEKMFDHIEGQFAVALFDRRQRRVILARDRFGICPLYWSRQGDWLFFGSEIKAILASGQLPRRADLRGINHLFTFFGNPGPITCFEGVSSVVPGHFLDITADSRLQRSMRDRVYWELDFPDHGQEERGQDPKKLTDEFEAILYDAVAKRLRADVPVVSCLSGGVDSSLVVALAGKVRGTPIPTFTIRIDDPNLDETSQAAIVAKHVGARPTIVPVSAHEILETYPRLVQAAEAPVIDTSCAAMLLLAQQIHASGFKVSLTGEGADEWLAGYPWFKINKLLNYFDAIPGLPLSQGMRRLFLRLSGSPLFSKESVRRTLESVGGSNAWLEFYGLVSLSKLRFFGPALQQMVHDANPYAELGLNQAGLKRWHPLHRSLYLGARVHLPGHQLTSKGDRLAMHSSVESRFPFLDEKVVSFLAKLHPSWKLKGFGDKHLLRLVAERHLPKEIAWRRKAMFRAPFDSFHLETMPTFVEQLFSPESLRKTGYFNVEAVQHARTAFKQMRPQSTLRTSVEMGLAGVLSTQLWHHMYIEPTLSELSTEPSQRTLLAPRRPAAVATLS